MQLHLNEFYEPFQPLLTSFGLSRYGLKYRSRPAKAPLKNVIHSFLQVSAVKPTPYPMLPDGTQAVFISCEQSKIGGAQSKYLEIPILTPGDYFGIRFYPGALRQFFELDLSEITDQMVDSHYFQCLKFNVLHHQIYQTQGFHERANLCEAWLLKHYKPLLSPRFQHALSLVYRSAGSCRINQLSKEVAVSSRHLNRMFHLHTGLSTKKFSQIIRLQFACKLLLTPASHASSVANELGFYDQSHLLNDFQKLLSLSPRSLIDRF